MGTNLDRLCFKWRDKKGFVWFVSRNELPTMVQWRAAMPQSWGTGKVCVKVREVGSQRPMHIARLTDVVVDSEVQDRGVGSMLIETAISYCQLLGSVGMDGELSCVDEGHFPKLKHFYEKLGFSFVVYDTDKLTENSNAVGKIGIRFDN